MSDANVHTIFYTLPRHQAVIVEYTPDPTKDMYQVRDANVFDVNSVESGFFFCAIDWQVVRGAD